VAKTHQNTNTTFDTIDTIDTFIMDSKSAKNPTMSVKYQLNGSGGLRRTSIGVPPCLQQLCNMLEQSFPELVGHRRTLVYTDDEGDEITVTNDAELAAAWHVANQAGRVLRLAVTATALAAPPALAAQPAPPAPETIQAKVGNLRMVRQSTCIMPGPGKAVAAGDTLAVGGDYSFVAARAVNDSELIGGELRTLVNASGSGMYIKNCWLTRLTRVPDDTDTKICVLCMSKPAVVGLWHVGCMCKCVCKSCFGDLHSHRCPVCNQVVEAALL
jgi:hypothetical protein